MSTGNDASTSFSSGTFKPGGSEGSLDLRLGHRLLVTQSYALAGRVHNLAVDLEFPVANQRLQHPAKSFLPQAEGFAQLLLADPLHQRIRFVELFDAR